MPRLENCASGEQIHFPQKNELILGRSKQCDLVLNDNRVSRNHARIYRMGSQWFIEDLGSTNGVQVNGQNRDQHMLAAGDLIELCAFRFIYQPDPEPSFESATNIRSSLTVASSIFLRLPPGAGRFHPAGDHESSGQRSFAPLSAGTGLVARI